MCRKRLHKNGVFSKKLHSYTVYCKKTAYFNYFIEI